MPAEYAEGIRSISPSLADVLDGRSCPYCGGSNSRSAGLAESWVCDGCAASVGLAKINLDFEILWYYANRTAAHSLWVKAKIAQNTASKKLAEIRAIAKGLAQWNGPFQKTGGNPGKSVVAGIWTRLEKIAPNNVDAPKGAKVLLIVAQGRLKIIYWKLDTEFEEILDNWTKSPGNKNKIKNAMVSEEVPFAFMRQKRGIKEARIVMARYKNHCSYVMDDLRKRLRAYDRLTDKGVINYLIDLEFQYNSNAEQNLIALSTALLNVRMKSGKQQALARRLLFLFEQDLLHRKPSNP